MKSRFLILLLIAGFTDAKAQNIFPSNGNVGIGTDNPSSILSVTSPANAWIQLNRAGTDKYMGIAYSTANQYKWFTGLRELGTNRFSVYNFRDDSEPLTILENGNVGLMNTSPLFRLQVQKTSNDPAIMIGGPYTQSPRLQVFGLDVDPQAWMGLGADMGGGHYEHSIYFPTGPVNARGKLTIGEYNGTTYNTKMVVLQNGNVGVGINYPADKLAVNGKIRAQEIKVETANWPDYVFAKDYVLPSLKETEKHIQEKGHLPGIPSAQEVKNNGVNLGEMNAKLLKKIEELTLYLIELKKENEEQKEINKKMNSSILSLSSQMESSMGNNNKHK